MQETSNPDTPANERPHLAVMWDRVLCQPAVNADVSRDDLDNRDFRPIGRALLRLRRIILAGGYHVHIILVRGPRLEDASRQQVREYLHEPAASRVTLHFPGRPVEDMSMNDRYTACSRFILETLLANPVRCLVGTTPLQQQAAYAAALTPYMDSGSFMEDLPIPASLHEPAVKEPPRDAEGVVA